MFTCPTAALEIMLNPLPLYMCVIKEAAINAYRIYEVINTKSGNSLGHMQIFIQTSISNVKQLGVDA